MVLSSLFDWFSRLGSRYSPEGRGLLASEFIFLKSRVDTGSRFFGEVIPPGSPGELPREIYMFWDKGFDAAPDVVKLCCESWKKHNEGWNLNLLSLDDANSILKVDSMPEGFAMAHYADALRTTILAERGGVWADATLLCAKRLDDWLLPMFNQSRFFAFYRPGPDRLLSNWFLAATASSVLAAGWREVYFDFLRDGYGPSTPYFFHHYLFEFMVGQSSAHRKAWKSVPKLSAEPSHLMQHLLSHESNAAQCLERLRHVPLHKLTWKEPSRVNAQSVLELLELMRESGLSQGCDEVAQARKDPPDVD